jgi:transposase
MPNLRRAPAAAASCTASASLVPSSSMVPAQLRVQVTRRLRYACRACEGAVVMAPAPERPIDSGMPTEALIVHVVVSKFCDPLPLYRQAQMLARQGMALDRATLCNWVGSACWG